MSQFVAITVLEEDGTEFSEALSCDTQAEIDEVAQRLAGLRVPRAPVYAGDPDGEDSVATGMFVYAAPWADGDGALDDGGADEEEDLSYLLDD